MLEHQISINLKSVAPDLVSGEHWSTIMNAEQLAYKNYPVKFTVYIFDVDVTRDVDNFGNIESSLDYPQLTEFRIGEANLVLSDYDSEGNPGRKYNPEYADNFFSQHGLRSGYKSPVRIEVLFLLPNGELHPRVDDPTSNEENVTIPQPIVIFEGQILSLSKGLKAGTVEITCSDLTQEFRTKNLDNFGIPKQFALTPDDDLVGRAGNYPIPYFFAPPSEGSVIPVKPSDLYEVDRLKNSGELSDRKFVVTDTSIQIEDGILKKDADETDTETGDVTHTEENDNPVFFFKTGYRDKRIKDLIKKIVGHYNIADLELELPEPELESRFFSNLGRVGYDFDKADTEQEFRWEGFVTDFIYAQNIPTLDDIGYKTPLGNPKGLVSTPNGFYTIDGNKIYKINDITGRVTEKFEIQNPSGTPLPDGLASYKDQILILTSNSGANRLYSANIFSKTPHASENIPSNDPYKVNLTTIPLTEKQSNAPSTVKEGAGQKGAEITYTTDNGGTVQSLVYHDEKYFIIKQNGMWRIDLEEVEDSNGIVIGLKGNLVYVGLFTLDFGDPLNPRVVCAASYNGSLYIIGQRAAASGPELWRVNHYTARATKVLVDLEAYTPTALSPHEGTLYGLSGKDIHSIVIKDKIPPYSFKETSIYEGSGGDKLFLLYSGSGYMPDTQPKIIEYDIKTETYEVIYEHVAGSKERDNEVAMHAEFWKIASDPESNYKTFYILGTEIHKGEHREYLGVYNAAAANKASPSRVKIWKFDRVPSDPDNQWDVFIQHDTHPTQRERATFPVGKAPPQLAMYYHSFPSGRNFRFNILPDSRKSFEVYNGNLYYLWSNNWQFGVAKASSSGLIQEVFTGINDGYLNNCGCDFAIDREGGQIYGAFTFIDMKRQNSTFNVYQSSA